MNCVGVDVVNMVDPLARVAESVTGGAATTEKAIVDSSSGLNATVVFTYAFPTWPQKSMAERDEKPMYTDGD